MLPDNPFTHTAFDSTDGGDAGSPFPGGTVASTFARRCTPPATHAPSTANDFSLLAKRADDATALLKVLCNENRLLIFLLLVDNPMTVGEISRRTSQPQNDVSMNLEKLRKAALVQFHQHGKFRYYRVSDSGRTRFALSILERIETAKPNPS